MWISAQQQDLEIQKLKEKSDTQAETIQAQQREIETLKHVLEHSKVNPFPNTPFWDGPKFKEASNDNWNVAIKEF